MICSAESDISCGSLQNHLFHPEFPSLPSKKPLPRVIVVYLFNGDRGAGGGSGRRPPAGEKEFRGEVCSRLSVVASDMGFSLLVEPRLGFDHLGFRGIDHYDVVSVSKVDLPAL